MSIKKKRDGRTIRKGVDYSNFRRDIWEIQEGRCMLCDRRTHLLVPIEADYSFHLHHLGSRGMGSAIRDDVLGTKRGQVGGGLCGKCHREGHHQQ